MPLTETISELIGLTAEEVYGPELTELSRLHDVHEDTPVEFGGFSEVEPNTFLSTEEEPF